MTYFKSIIGAPAVPVPVQLQSTPGNLPVNPSTIPNSNNPTVPIIIDPSKPIEPKSPLEPFADLFTIDSKNKEVIPDSTIFSRIDPKKIQEAASKIDFRSVISSEIQARIKAGGEDGVAASQEAMGVMAQAVFSQSAMASTALIEQAAKKIQQQFEAKIPSLLKSHNLKSSVLEDKVLSNPAVAPLVPTVTSQLQIKYPNASDSELRTLTANYFTAFAESLINAKELKSVSKKEPVSKSQDFSEWTT